MKEVAKSIDNIGFTQFTLDKGHDMWKIGFAGVGAIDDLWRRHKCSAAGLMPHVTDRMARDWPRTGDTSAQHQ